MKSFFLTFFLMTVASMIMWVWTEVLEVSTLLKGPVCRILMFLVAQSLHCNHLTSPSPSYCKEETLEIPCLVLVNLV